MKSVMDEEQIALLIQRLMCYKKLEDVNFQSINQSLDTLSSYYKTYNTYGIKNIQRQISNNFRRRNEYNNVSILVYDKNLEKYIATAQSTVKSFKEIK